MSLFIDKASRGIMLDIGCNHGGYLPEMAQKATKIYAFEPHPDNIKKIQARIEQNDITYTRIEVCQVALCDRNETIKFYTNPGNEGGHTISEVVAAADQWGACLARFIEVEGRTLDSYNLTGVTACKIDVEGAEQSVLVGGKNTFMNNQMYVELETHQTINREEIYDLIRSYGYQVFDKAMKDKVHKLIYDDHYILTNIP